MYAVSDEYKDAMKKPVQRFRMTGTVSEKQFTDENILKGSFSITNQCCDDAEMKIGQVYVGELNVTLTNLNLEKYSMMNKAIKPVFGRMLRFAEYEDIPLGVFNISEAEWTAAGLVIKAYDNISKLDKDCTVTSSIGKPYELALLACESCEVELGTTEEEFAAFANGEEILSMFPENDVETWRDFVSWIAQTCACFATCDRFGKIVFRPYGTEIVDTIDPQHRFSGGSFSDYETRYTGVSVVNIADKTTTYYGVEPDDALTYNLGSNPFLQYGLKETLEKTRRAVLNGLQSIRYVPFRVQMIGDPVYDLGDVLSFTDGIADSEKLFCLTKYTFNYNGKYEIQGVGKNPKLASARSKVDKNLAGILGQINTKDIIFYNFVNAYGYTIGDGQKTKIISLDYTSQSGGTAEFKAFVLLSSAATVPVTPEGETPAPAGYTIAKVTYVIDTAEISTYCPIETYLDGSHALFLYYPITNITNNEVSRMEVYLEVSGGTIEIGQGQILANVSGQGLAAKLGDWDGKLEFQEAISCDIPGMDMSMGATVNITRRTPGRTLFAEAISFDIPGMAVDFVEDLVVSQIYVQDIMSTLTKELCAYDVLHVQTDNNVFELRTAYTFESQEVTVDTGRMMRTQIITEGMQSIESMGWR